MQFASIRINSLVINNNKYGKKLRNIGDSNAFSAVLCRSNKICIMKIIITLIFGLVFFTTMAQNSTDIEIQIEWKDPIVFKDISGQNQKLEYFTGALYDYPESNLPVYSTLVPLSQSTSSIEVEIMNASYDTFERRITLSV